MTGEGVGADSEVGRLRTVMLHRPGDELKRLTPRNNDDLLFDGLPWVGRAQEEHDAFAELLRDRGVEVLYLTELLTEALGSEPVRTQAITQTLAGQHLGETLRSYLTRALSELPSDELTHTLTAGLRNDEVRGGQGVVTALLAHDDFLIDPLPNLLFTRDSSVWLPDRALVTSLAMPARVRETQLTELIYAHHPRFAHEERIPGWSLEHIEGGDVLLLGPGVIAIGVGERTTPAGAERLTREVLGSGLAHTVLAVPIAQQRATMHLDTVCTMVGPETVVMYPNIADSLQARTITLGEPRRTTPRPSASDPEELSAGDPEPLSVSNPEPLSVSNPEPFLVAAARALGIPALQRIDTGLDPVTAEREQWDDGNNTLAIAPNVAIAYERNEQTNAQLERAGIEVLRIAGSEMGSGRGGPRCMSCPIRRDPVGPA